MICIEHLDLSQILKYVRCRNFRGFNGWRRNDFKSCNTQRCPRAGYITRVTGLKIRWDFKHTKIVHQSYLNNQIVGDWSAAPSVIIPPNERYAGSPLGP